MSISTPIALILLLALIPIVALGWPRSRFRRTRDGLSLVLRVVIVCLVVFALAGTQVVQSADRLAVVFLVDVSDSMSSQNQADALDYVSAALESMQPDDEAALIVFGSEAQVARSMSTTRELGPIRAQPNSGNTNIAAAIRLGLALFPGDTARRMVILTDGQPTIGDTDGAARLASSAGVEISYVQFMREDSPEVQLVDVTVPTTIDEGQEFDMTVTIASEEDSPAQVTVMGAGEIITTQQLNLLEGENSYTLRLVSGAPGFRDFQVLVNPLGADGFYQNNTLGAFTRVEGPSKVLVVGNGNSAEIQYLVPALQEAGVVVDVVQANNIPRTITGLAQYDSVALVNVSAVGLSNEPMELLERYVSELGGGLVVIGGPESYGPGGYFQTPLEDALPVEMQIRDQQRLPQLTLAYLIDRSGSMGAVGQSGITNIDLAKGAIVRSIDFLQPTDRAGLASFDTQAYWVAQIQDVVDRRELQRLIATLRPTGGTSIKAGMDLVEAAIIREESQVKHIILLTDGGAEPRGLVEQSARLYENHNVTTSVISIGEFEAEFLQRMAEVSGGNYHNVIDPRSIPEIFALETVLATRTYIQEEQFNPILTAEHPIMQSLNALPSLQGYVATTERPTARVILRGPEPYSDPLLVAWQYGLGRSVAFTSDATARWAQNWVGWDGFATFWSQAVRWTITEGTSSNLETRVVMEDARARVIVDARDNEGNFLNGLNLQSSIIGPEQSGQRLQLRQIAPGRYEATFTPNNEGAYLLRVTNQTNLPEDTTEEDQETSALELAQTTGWVMSYSPEYEVRDFDDAVLENLADLTRGGDLGIDPALAFAHNIDAQDAAVPLWPWLLLASAILLPFDVGVRRLLITRSDLRRLNTWFQTRVLLRGRNQGHEATAERLSTLRQARDRARQTTEDAVTSNNTISALRNRRQESREQPEAAPPEIKSAEPTTPRFSRPHPDLPVKEKAPEGNIGSRLLKNRRRDEDEG